MYAKGSMIVYEINNKVTTNFNIKMIFYKFFIYFSFNLKIYSSIIIRENN